MSSSTTNEVVIGLADDVATQALQLCGQVGFRASLDLITTLQKYSEARCQQAADGLCKVSESLPTQEANDES